VLFIGQQNGWITKSDIADYAVNLLSLGLDNGDENIAVLAIAESFDDSELRDLLLQVGGEAEKTDSVEKWRLAELIALCESALSDEEKLNRLQDLYAKFDYPEDMSSCSIYSQDSVNPKVAMLNVISSLKRKYLRKTS
jgi:hypothetical protein